MTRNSSREQIRDAYWKIATANHPDRNNSVQALEIFRNASHAYKVLGKDKRQREIYDAQDFGKAMVDVTSSVVVPLARDVALPLLNITIRGIGYFAKPIIRDVFEQTNAVYKGKIVFIF